MDNAIPTDSVLRRHYEASQSKPSQNNTPSQNDNSNSGIMGWLKRLFGG